MDKPKIYVACLASYNNGILYGEWIDATQSESEVMADIQTLLANSPIENAEEFAIHDFEGFGNLRLDEYESIATVVAYAEFIVEHDELGQALLAEYGLEDAEKMVTDCYHGCYDSEVDFAWHLFEECYSNAIPDNLMCYFDCEAFARDLFISDYCSVEGNGMTHVFSRY
ncbi:antirestriction protein ArdA [Legionella taurinensis]|uniref:antirestriction protein ArdA n=1 Tax=Legionella taurinensis TaxID=70611 RepID=UPI000E011815|nr:antirestriction protein ArdA [Legionella taurinensis]STY25158.1 antirestriction protein [Legionella taurinensis]